MGGAKEGTALKILPVHPGSTALPHFIMLSSHLVVVMRNYSCGTIEIDNNNSHLYDRP